MIVRRTSPPARSGKGTGKGKGTGTGKGETAGLEPVAEAHGWTYTPRHGASGERVTPALRSRDCSCAIGVRRG
jgi:hypothetical protein